MPLAIPLTPDQIDAAQQLHARLGQWRAADDALRALAKQFPGFDSASTLLKVVTVNALYGTNVLAIIRMATHVRGVLEKTNLEASGPELVERLAGLPPAKGQRPRRHHSFAAKFAHFFINEHRFPIMDSYAAQMLVAHLGRANIVQDPRHPYVAFSRNLGTLKALAALQVTNRELDRYLWLAGQYRAWHKGRERRSPVQINVELARLFVQPSRDIVRALARLLPAGCLCTTLDEPEYA